MIHASRILFIITCMCKGNRTNLLITVLLGLILFTGSSNASDKGAAKIESYPYHASLRIDGKHVCSGVITAKQKVVTSARCALLLQPLAQGKFPRGFVHVGSADSTGHETSPRRIAAVYVHPWYQHGLSPRHDIAIIKLLKPIIFDAMQDTALYVVNGVLEGAIANVTGWRDTPKQLQVASVKVISKANCQKLLKTKVFPEQLCAINVNDDSAFQNDGGSPLVSKDKIGGIASCADRLCVRGPPNVYTNVSYYLNFLRFVEYGYNPLMDDSLIADPRHPSYVDLSLTTTTTTIKPTSTRRTTTTKPISSTTTAIPASTTTIAASTSIRTTTTTKPTSTTTTTTPASTTTAATPTSTRTSTIRTSSSITTTPTSTSTTTTTPSSTTTTTPSTTTDDGESTGNEVCEW